MDGDLCGVAGTPADSRGWGCDIQNLYRGGPKAYKKKGLKQKQTSPPDELENTQNQCYKYDCIIKSLRFEYLK